MTVVSAIFCTCVRKIIFHYSYPSFYLISKEQNDEELRAKYAKKAADRLYRTIYFIIAVGWGWAVLKDTDFLPSYLGGQNNGDYKNINVKSIYSEYPYELITYSYFTFGYHF